VSSDAIEHLLDKPFALTLYQRHDQDKYFK